jgi:apolipoprotein N-acyltransferase
VSVATALIASAFAYGEVRLGEVRESMRDAPKLRAALVHAELPNPARLSPGRALEAIDRYLALTPDDVDLVAWPENTVNVLLEDNPRLVDRIAARAARARYLVGAPRMTADRALYASAFVIGPRGIEAAYDKQRVLPLGETSGGTEGRLGFAPARSISALRVGDARIGVSICWEAVFPEIARAAVNGGAQVLVNLSNDSWFEVTSGPRIHFLFGRLRAVETRRAVLRAANLGVTAVVLPDGSVAAQSSGRANTTVASVPLLSEQTIYSRYGDCFAWLCVVACVVAACRAKGLATGFRAVLRSGFRYNPI